MNIFFLDRDPELCAQYHCDKHCSKMILETAQLLSTAHHVLAPDSFTTGLCYKKTHENHPSAIWARSSAHAYSWLYELFCALNKEFRFRRGKDHASFTKLKHVLSTYPEGIDFDAGYSEPPQCMPEKYHNADPVYAYRQYYMNDKADIATWNWGRPAPEWWVTVMDALVQG